MHATRTASAASRHATRIQSLDKAPIPAALRAQLVKDTASIQALKSAARRHGDAELEDWDARIELEAAREHFELGCWLAYYSTRVYLPEGLQDRIDCAARILRSGITRFGYQFYTAFRFSERYFDTCFEMGDSDAVAAGLYDRAVRDPELAAGLARVGMRSPA